eukprot:5222453-Pyramimonas_sp.AAC.1
MLRLLEIRGRFRLAPACAGQLGRQSYPLTASSNLALRCLSLAHWSVHSPRICSHSRATYAKLAML